MVMLCDDQEVSANETIAHLEQHGFKVKRSLTGKDCQLQVYKNPYYAVILNMSVRDHGPMTVLKYLSINHPSVRVILIFSKHKLFTELDYNVDELKKMGANDVIIEPKSNDVILSSLLSMSQSEDWKNVKEQTQIDSSERVEIKAYDETFTKIKIEDFYVGKISVFDYYLRLAKNKYVKILMKGERFEQERFKRYLNDDRIEYLYFQTKDRTAYINYMNNVCKKLESCPTLNIDRKITALSSVVEKYIEEVYVSGINEDLVKEGLKISDTVYKVAQDTPDLKKLLRKMQDIDPRYLNHSFLTTLFSTIIAGHLDWPTKRTIELLSLGSFFHDVGKIKLPKQIREKSESNLTESEMKEFKNHCHYALELLDTSKEIPESIKLISYQHHESVSGGGYPKGITGSKIYPLAKIIALADQLSYFVIDQSMTPLLAYQTLIGSPKLVQRYDSQLIKSFGQSLIMEKKL